MNDLIDESDPDTDLPNIAHAFQSKLILIKVHRTLWVISFNWNKFSAAERARTEYPALDWLHLAGLIHDMGKVMAFYDELQWA